MASEQSRSENSDGYVSILLGSSDYSQLVNGPPRSEATKTQPNKRQVSAWIGSVIHGRDEALLELDLQNYLTSSGKRCKPLVIDCDDLSIDNLQSSVLARLVEWANDEIDRLGANADLEQQSPDPATSYELADAIELCRRFDYCGIGILGLRSFFAKKFSSMHVDIWMRRVGSREFSEIVQIVELLTDVLSPYATLFLSGQQVDDLMLDRSSDEAIQFPGKVRGRLSERLRLFGAWVDQPLERGKFLDRVRLSAFLTFLRLQAEQLPRNVAEKSNAEVGAEAQVSTVAVVRTAIREYFRPQKTEADDSKLDPSADARNDKTCEDQTRQEPILSPLKDFVSAPESGKQSLRLFQDTIAAQTKKLRNPFHKNGFVLENSYSLDVSGDNEWVVALNEKRSTANELDTRIKDVFKEASRLTNEMADIESLSRDAYREQGAFMDSDEFSGEFEGSSLVASPRVSVSDIELKNAKQGIDDGRRNSFAINLPVAMLTQSVKKIREHLQELTDLKRDHDKRIGSLKDLLAQLQHAEGLLEREKSGANESGQRNQTADVSNVLRNQIENLSIEINREFERLGAILSEISNRVDGLTDAFGALDSEIKSLTIKVNAILVSLLAFSKIVAPIERWAVRCCYPNLEVVERVLDPMIKAIVRWTSSSELRDNLPETALFVAACLDKVPFVSAEASDVEMLGEFLGEVRERAAGSIRQDSFEYGRRLVLPSSRILTDAVKDKSLMLVPDAVFGFESRYSQDFDSDERFALFASWIQEAKGISSINDSSTVAHIMKRLERLAEQRVDAAIEGEDIPTDIHITFSNDMELLNNLLDARALFRNKYQAELGEIELQLQFCWAFLTACTRWSLTIPTAEVERCKLQFLAAIRRCERYFVERIRDQPAESGSPRKMLQKELSLLRVLIDLQIAFGRKHRRCKDTIDLFLADVSTCSDDIQSSIGAVRAESGVNTETRELEKFYLHGLSALFENAIRGLDVGETESFSAFLNKIQQACAALSPGTLAASEIGDTMLRILSARVTYPRSKAEGIAEGLILYSPDRLSHLGPIWQCIDPFRRKRALARKPEDILRLAVSYRKSDRQASRAVRLIAKEFRDSLQGSSVDVTDYADSSRFIGIGRFWRPGMLKDFAERRRVALLIGPSYGGSRYCQHEALCVYARWLKGDIRRPYVLVLDLPSIESKSPEPSVAEDQSSGTAVGADVAEGGADKANPDNVSEDESSESKVLVDLFGSHIQYVDFKELLKSEDPELDDLEGDELNSEEQFDAEIRLLVRSILDETRAV